MAQICASYPLRAAKGNNDIPSCGEKINMRDRIITQDVTLPHHPLHIEFYLFQFKTWNVKNTKC